MKTISIWKCSRCVWEGSENEVPQIQNSIIDEKEKYYGCPLCKAPTYERWKNIGLSDIDETTLIILSTMIKGGEITQAAVASEYHVKRRTLKEFLKSKGLPYVREKVSNTLIQEATDLLEEIKTEESTEKEKPIQPDVSNLHLRPGREELIINCKCGHKLKSRDIYDHQGITGPFATAFAPCRGCGKEWHII